MVGLGMLTAVPALAVSADHHGHHGHAAKIPASDTAYLLVAPDRGFLGNTELQDSFEAFAKGRNAMLVYTTDDRTQKSVTEAVKSLVKTGAKRVVVLPFFLSDADPGYQRVQAILKDSQARAGAQITWSQPFGDSYFAVEMLTQRLSAVAQPQGRTAIVVSTGAMNAKSQQAMQADLERIAKQAADGLDFKTVKVVVNAAPDALKRELEAAAKGAERPVIVPFHLGKKLDGMMSFDASLQQAAPKGVALIEGEIASHAALPLWFGREANRAATLRPEEIGVILMAHGSDHHWNETMINAVKPLASRYMIEPALSMADPVVTERAVRKLESRGAKAIVIVRVFGLSDSFKSDVERMIGIDVETAAHHAAMGHHAMASGHGGHRGHGGHGGHGMMMGNQRILSSALMTTVGGLDASPLFAEALLDRANALSQDSKKETIILVAHGTSSNARNSEWEQNLESLAGTMRAKGGGKFRAIKTATWREDWPDLREPSIAKVRKFVEEGNKDGGRVIVIPARTTAQGPEKRLLEGLTFVHGSGFAPHPKFVAWFEAQIQSGIATFSQTDRAAEHHAH
jgi:sirohydrochlorin ferrochelatase